MVYRLSDWQLLCAQMHLDRVASGLTASASHRSLQSSMTPQASQHLGSGQYPMSHHYPHPSRSFRGAQPEAIVSLVPAGTEILYALGLGSRCSLL